MIVLVEEPPCPPADSEPELVIRTMYVTGKQERKSTANQLLK